MGERVILHSDLNAFYASVEMMFDPSLKGKAVAVCGSTEDRHGIVLAKSELAKKAGVKTGMVTWEAKQKCRDLIVLPPSYEKYLLVSEKVRQIYYRYTDQVEPFGMDECWLDVTGSVGILGEGEAIADKIRKDIREELGLTVSIGVSFNKIFAKLGSDMKKPDAVTVITKDNFRDKVWSLPATDLLYVGAATGKKLFLYQIYTIGDIAKSTPEFMQRRLGKNGTQLWVFANGQDESRVMYTDFTSPVKSIGHGTTCTSDLKNNSEVWRVMLELSQDVGHRLRLHGLSATGVQITIKDNTLFSKQFQTRLRTSTQSPLEIARYSFELFKESYMWYNKIRALTVRAITLIPESTPQQLDLFDDAVKREKRDKIDVAVESIRRRFGDKSIQSAVLLGDLKMSGQGASEIIMPGVMYR
ncbi:MAG: DNA polymerase IV [Eubacteriales bacterium]